MTPSDDIAPSTENYGVLTTERIISMIDRNKDRLALVLLSGVQYLTGSEKIYSSRPISQLGRAPRALPLLSLGTLV